jgi:crotonobetainyl-CoA:carnitine CoA-transferase CaiB-like acyl-CoA transferase
VNVDVKEQDYLRNANGRSVQERDRGIEKKQKLNEKDGVCDHPQVKARDMIIRIEDFKGSGKTLNLTGIPIKLSDTPGQIELKFPSLGEHTKELLLSLGGYTTDEVDQLAKDGVI